MTFTAHLPDMHHYPGHHGGVVRPLYRDADGRELNVTPGLVAFLETRLGVRVTGEDVFAYVAGLMASGGFSERFAALLDGTSARVPLTASPMLFRAAAQIGRRLLWLHTYGERFADDGTAAEAGPPRQTDASRPGLVAAIPDTVAGMPNAFSYDPETETLHVGDGVIHPVAPEVWRYHVSGMPVVKKWLGYRVKNPKGKRSSPLDDQTASTWPPQLTDELLDLLNVLGLLVELEPRQAALLDETCDGPLIQAEELRAAGVLPLTAASRAAPTPAAQARLLG